MSTYTTGESTGSQNKSCRNIIITFTIIACVGVIIIISLFIWNFAFRYKGGGVITPAQCQADSGVVLDGWCYVPSTDQLSWPQAEAACVKKSGHLASIASAEVNTGVVTQINKITSNWTNSWIGLNSNAAVYQYQYSDGTNVTYTNWAASSLLLSPSEAQNRRCATISDGDTPQLDNATSGQWVLQVCATPYYYVCRYMLATAPFPPTMVVASQIKGGASVGFTKPSSDGGKPISNYTVTSWPDMINVTSASTPVQVKNLRPYIQYSFTVVATNEVGSSAPSDPSSPIMAGPTNPDPPTAVMVKPANQAAVIFFTPPVSDGGAPLVGYTVTPQGGSPAPITFNMSLASGNQISFPGLTNGQSYNFSITVQNSAPYSSTPVNIGPVTPKNTIPNPPNPVPTATGEYKSVLLVWGPSSGADNYTITYFYQSGDGGVWFTPITTTTLNYTVMNLTIGTTYYFTITANSPGGTSTPSPQLAATPIAVVPFSTSVPVATSGGRSATIDFLAPSDDGGMPITAFVAQANDTSVPSVQVNVSNVNMSEPFSISVTNLTANKYYFFTVYAINAEGNGIVSQPSNTIQAQAGPPDPPQSVMAVAAGQGATVSFSAPQNDGGSNITNYTIISYPGNFMATTTALLTTNIAIGTGSLSVNINYTFKVIAWNANGPSSPSSPSNPVQPFPNKPGAPQMVKASPGPQLANVTWMPPMNDGGVPITEYSIVSNPANVSVYVWVNSTTPLNAIVPNLFDVKQTYTFTVTAMNSVGWGQPGVSTGISVNANVPDPPVNLIVKASFTGAAISFTAPPNDGGSPILSYYALSSPPTGNYSNNDSPIYFKDLDNDLNYTFVVYAVNAQGASVASLPSESFRRASQLVKDLAIPIAGGIILGLLFIVGVIIGIFFCKNNEKCCWAREGGSTTNDKVAATSSNTSVDLDYVPKDQPQREMAPSSSTYETDTNTTETTSQV